MFLKALRTLDQSDSRKRPVCIQGIVPQMDSIRQTRLSFSRKRPVSRSGSVSTSTFIQTVRLVSIFVFLISEK